MLMTGSFFFFFFFFRFLKQNQGGGRLIMSETEVLIAAKHMTEKAGHNDGQAYLRALHSHSCCEQTPK